MVDDAVVSKIPIVSLLLYPYYLVGIAYPTCHYPHCIYYLPLSTFVLDPALQRVIDKMCKCRDAI